MKKIIIGLLSILFFSTVDTKAQKGILYLPGNTVIKPYFLQVGYTTSTVVVFPTTIVDADKGFTDIIIEKQNGVENILKIKATNRNFSPTNVHVYTNDQKVYAFNVQYSDTPYHTTFDLNKLEAIEGNPASVNFTNPAATSYELQHQASLVKNVAPFFPTKQRKHKMILQLTTIHTFKDVTILGFRLFNRSSLAFDIDFDRIYITDEKKGKRTSFQQQEMTPLYTDTLKQVAADTNFRFTIAVPKFSIPDKKVFFIEIFEKNGGRHISLRIKNRHLLKARPL